MAESIVPPAARLPAHLLAWPRVKVALVAGTIFGSLFAIASPTPWLVWLVRTWFVALVAVVAFGLPERTPEHAGQRVPRWVLQLVAVMVSVPFTAWIAYWVTNAGDTFWWHDGKRLSGWGEITFTGVLFGPWIALASLVRAREAFARDQALRFQLERSELERRAVDARLRLLQAQVQPHFLFNTLANVRALVRAGSPRAGEVLDSLVAYLRASVPHLEATSTPLGRELDLVQAYLELMHLRMPDRLQYTLHAEPAARMLHCPPLTLLTLVENAVRHGIDPSEDGGPIDVGVTVRNGRCLARVADTGVGMVDETPAGALHPPGSGTGLATLRERLRLAFAGDARLAVSCVQPHGVLVEVEFPAQPSEENAA
jgi:hypothetical protein